MRIHYIGSSDNWYLSDLRRAAARRHELISLTYQEITAETGGLGRDTTGNTLFSGIDAAIIRTMPPGSLEQIIFRMDALGQMQQAGVCMLNSPRAMEVAIDKFLASARLAVAGLLTPRTHVSQQWQAAMAGFQELGGDVVVKPLFGGEGRGITRITDIELAERAFKMLAQIGAVIYQQQFIPHDGSDLRILVLGQRVWGMRRRNGKDWRTNISRGAIGEPVALSDELIEIAHRAAASVEAIFAGVDILEGRDGNRYVLEVNAVPGWKALSQILNVDVAAAVLSHLEEATT